MISTTILKSSIHYISLLLTYIRNRMKSSGIFPTRIKFSEVNRYLKKEIKMIHLIIDLFLCLHHFQRFLKMLLIIDYIIIINNYQFLANERFGFRHASSTDIASCKLTSNILTALNNKLLVGGIFCDLYKAFDCVNYDICSLKWNFMVFLEKQIT